PEWLERKAAAGKMTRLPKREDIAEPITEQDIVEFYSR
ncbi:MAG TPA: 30S ribosomal protein S4, partial [Patescibacteria group bacterium]|nr:30S ribosomal protein S4 [Patescibacteria group bacterium]